MLNFTPLLRRSFVSSVARAHRTLPNDAASETLSYLCRCAARTEVAQRFDFSSIRSYSDFADKLPVVSYPDIRHDIERMIAGEKNVLWRGRCTRFAQSSGTSDGKSKYIPVTDDSLRLNHYRGSAGVVARYLNLYPDSRIFSGKAFILGGSFANEIKGLPNDVRVGDLSANLIDNINPVVNLLRVPDKRTALMADWTQKLPALVNASLHENITNISGVPSWFLTVLREVIKKAGATTIHDVWQNLEVFFHGGISFDPYREQYKAITDPAKMRYLETYNASEGFFAAQDTLDPAAGMELLLNIGVFYEFVPLSEAGEPHPHAETVATAKEGDTYSLVITAPNGLWRYAIGDTVTITSLRPFRIKIAGRTKAFINAFGEELMVHNADAAITLTCQQTSSSILNYTAAPVYTTDRTRGRHQWLIEWHTPPKDIEEFADLLDQNLQKQNSDYQAKRSGNIFLDRLSVVSARQGLFDRWLALTGKLGGQRKVPRLANDRTIIDALLSLDSQL